MYKYRHYVLFWSLDPCFGKNYFTRNFGVFQNSMAWCSKGKALWTWKCKALLPSPCSPWPSRWTLKPLEHWKKPRIPAPDLQGRWPHTGWSRTWKHQWGMQTWNYTLGPKATESVCTFQCATKRALLEVRRVPLYYYIEVRERAVCSHMRRLCAPKTPDTKSDKPINNIICKIGRNPSKRKCTAGKAWWIRRTRLETSWNSGQSICKLKTKKLGTCDNETFYTNTLFHTDKFFAETLHTRRPLRDIF